MDLNLLEYNLRIMRLTESYWIKQDIGYHGSEGMKALAEKLNTNLSESPIANTGVIYHGKSSVIIKADKPSQIFPDCLMRLLRKSGYLMSLLRKIYHKKIERHPDLHIDVIVDDSFAEINLHDPKDWKQSIYQTVKDTVSGIR